MLQKGLDPGDDLAAMFGAHEGRKMDRSFGHEGVQVPAILSRVHDAEHLVVSGKFHRKIIPDDGL